MSRRVGIEHVRNEGSTTGVSGWVNERANVANLPTAFGIERRLAENHFAFIALVQNLSFFLTSNQRERFRIVNSGGLVAAEQALNATSDSGVDRF